MDDVSPGIGLQCWIKLEVFTWNDVSRRGVGWLNCAKDMLQVHQVLYKLLVLNIVLVQCHPDGCGEGASHLPVFGRVPFEQVEVVGQGGHVLVEELLEMFLSMLGVVGQSGDNSSGN